MSDARHRPSIRAIQRQFVLSGAAMGALLPYLPVFLLDRLGDHTRVGLVLGVMGVAIILTPVVMTALADTRFQSRSLIVASFALSAAACVLMLVGFTLASLLSIYLLFCFAFWPQPPLQDGLLFATNRQRERADEPQTPYHRVRVYGTLGFILPLILLYFLLDGGLGVEVVLWVAAGIAALGAVNALSLPHVPLAEARPLDPDAPPLPHPTRAAAAVLFRGPAGVFCLAMFLAHLANAAYYSYYPIYLEDTVGFSEKWIGPINMAGVVLELPLMLAVGFLTWKLGIKGLLLTGLALMLGRLALLGLAPTQAVAVGTQLVHGMTVVAIYVLPPIYLNTLAVGDHGDRFRNSIQGLYAMAVFGPSRIVGTVAAGVMADGLSMTAMFNASAALTAAAIVLLAIGFRVGPAYSASMRQARA